MNILQYESKIWATADLLRGSGIKESEWPSFMMPFFALAMIESRLVRMFDNLKEEIGEAKFAQINKDDLYDMIRDEGQGYNVFIFEKNQTLKDICKNDKSFEIDFDAYLKGFDGDTRLRERFQSAKEAENWLISQLEILRQVNLFGARKKRTFNEAAAKYLVDHRDKVSIQTDIYMLESIMPFIGSLTLEKIHDATLAPYIAKRKAMGRANKTINLALGIVRRILNLAARSWRDETGKTWLETPPLIKQLPLVGFQREPRPMSWSDQGSLFALLPKHLLSMALFDVNTGARDEVVCGLKWEWEIEIPELETSVFLVPKDKVKGRMRDRVLVCNKVAKQVIDAQRGLHDEYVFTYRGHRVETMNNSAWQRARRLADLGDLHVHDIRHTVGMRLRESGVREETIADILWHNRPSMTAHYSVAQVAELYEALNRISNESSRVNRSLLMIAREAQAKVPQKSPTNKKGLEANCI